MNKRSVLVISCLILLPIVFSAFVIIKWQKNNVVVADYGKTIDIIEYNGTTLYAVPDPDSYMTMVGNYLGKVSDRLLGAPFYTVKNDSSGTLYAIASEKGTVIYTESGTLPVAAYRGTSITRIIIGSFDYEITEEKSLNIIRNIVTLSSSAVYTPSEEEKVKEYELHFFYDNCPVSASACGRLLYFEESGTWFYLSSEAKNRAEESYKSGDADGKYYEICLVTSGEAIRYLKSLLLPGSQGQSTDTDEQTGTETRKGSGTDTETGKETGTEVTAQP